MARNTKHYTKKKKNSSASDSKTQNNDRMPEGTDMTAAPVEPRPISIDKTILRKDSLERAKKRPIRERIFAFFRKEKDKDYKELIINTEALERRVARIENGILQGFDVERLDEDRMVGAIFKGKVQNLEPGLKAAFVDIGQEKNAFLHYWDMLPGANNDPSIEIVRENKKRTTKNCRGYANLSISSC